VTVHGNSPATRERGTVHDDQRTAHPSSVHPMAP
jgi:hypothetical protein